MDSKLPDLYIAAQHYAGAMYDVDRGADSRMGAEARKEYDTAIAAHVAAAVAASTADIFARIEEMLTNMQNTTEPCERERFEALHEAASWVTRMKDVTTTPTVEARDGDD